MEKQQHSLRLIMQIKTTPGGGFFPTVTSLTELVKVTELYCVVNKLLHWGWVRQWAPEGQSKTNRGSCRYCKLWKEHKYEHEHREAVTALHVDVSLSQTNQQQEFTKSYFIA